MEKPPETIQEILDYLEERKGRINGIFVVTIQDEGVTINTTSLGINFNGALLIQYLVKNFVDERFVNEQANGQKGN